MRRITSCAALLIATALFAGCAAEQHDLLGEGIIRSEVVDSKYVAFSSVTATSNGSLATVEGLANRSQKDQLPGVMLLQVLDEKGKVLRTLPMQWFDTDQATVLRFKSMFYGVPVAGQTLRVMHDPDAKASEYQLTQGSGDVGAVPIGRVGSGFTSAGGQFDPQVTVLKSAPQNQRTDYQGPQLYSGPGAIGGAGSRGGRR